MKKAASILIVFFCSCIICTAATLAKTAERTHKPAVLSQLLKTKNSILELRWQPWPYARKIMKLHQYGLEINGIENRINTLGLGMDTDIRNALSETKAAHNRTKTALIRDHKKRILKERLIQIREALKKLQRGNAPISQKRRKLDQYEREVKNIITRFNELNLGNVGVDDGKPMSAALADYLKTLSIENLLTEIKALMQVLRNKLGGQETQSGAVTVDIQ